VEHGVGSRAGITSMRVLRPRFHDVRAVHTGSRLNPDGWIHGDKIRRMLSSFRCRVSGRLPCLGESSLALSRAGFWLWWCRQVQLLTCALIFASGAWGGCESAVPSIRKLVAGSEHGVRRPRGFRSGGGQQSLRF